MQEHVSRLPVLPCSPARSAWRRGIAAAAACWRPAFLLWLAAAGLLWLYLGTDQGHRILGRVADWKLRVGWPFAVVSTACFGAAIPWLLERWVRTARQTSPGQALFLALFWAFKGLEIDVLYRLQSALWGSGRDPGTVLLKILTDQFVYLPLWAAPGMEIAYRLKDGRSLPRSRRLAHWYREEVVPLLFLNWVVWVPTVLVIYLLPLPLQLPVQNLVLCLWAILLLVFLGPDHAARPNGARR